MTGVDSLSVGLVDIVPDCRLMLTRRDVGKASSRMFWTAFQLTSEVEAEWMSGS